MEATVKILGWRLHLLDFYFNVVHRAGIKSQTADTLLRLKIGGEDNAGLDDNLQEMMLSLIQHWGQNINNNRDGDSHWLYICQQSDDTLQTESSALPEVAVIAQATTTHIATELTPTLGAFLRAQASYCEYQAPIQIVELPASLLLVSARVFWYEKNY